MKKEKMEKNRTLQQNKALHKYCELVAKSLNDAGLTIEEVLQHFTMEIQWTKESVKEILWKTAQRRMFNKESTKDLDRAKEITEIWEVMNRFLAKLKVESIPFPSLEQSVDNLALPNKKVESKIKI